MSLTRRDFVVKRSSIKGAGKGLFAKVDIQPNTCIGDYTGVIIKGRLEDSAFAGTDYALEIIEDKYYIVAEGPYCSYTRFINHKPKKAANVAFWVDPSSKVAWIESTRKIKKGEELFIDYGPEADLFIE